MRQNFAKSGKKKKRFQLKLRLLLSQLQRKKSQRKRKHQRKVKRHQKKVKLQRKAKLQKKALKHLKKKPKQKLVQLNHQLLPNQNKNMKSKWEIKRISANWSSKVQVMLLHQTWDGTSKISKINLEMMMLLFSKRKHWKMILKLILMTWETTSILMEP